MQRIVQVKLGLVYDQKHSFLACLVRQRLVSWLAGTVVVKPKEATATLQSDMTVGGTDLFEQVKVKVRSKLN